MKLNFFVINKKWQILIIINMILLVVLLSYNLYSFFKSNSIFYVDDVKLFDGFKMTQEIELAGEKRLIKENTL